jgi:pyocin large subunit-like protein
VSGIATTFEDEASKADHFQRHGSDFGAKTADEYEKMARDFLNVPLDVFAGSVLECTRRGNGDTIRFDTITEAFAIMRRDGIIRTFYKPDVAWHGYRTSLLYFQAECAR